MSSLLTRKRNDNGTTNTLRLTNQLENLAHPKYSRTCGNTSRCRRAAASLAPPASSSSSPPVSAPSPNDSSTHAALNSGTTTRPASMNLIFLGVSSTMTVLAGPNPAPTRPGVDQMSGRSRVVSQELAPWGSRALKGRS